VGYCAAIHVQRSLHYMMRKGDELRWRSTQAITGENPASWRRILVRLRETATRP
jgi:hypothetical protein